MEFNKCEELTVIDTVLFGHNTDREFYALTLSLPLNEEWRDWKAGQFVMIRPSSWGNEITWARPFSICRVTPHSLVLFFQIVGKGTKKIASLRSGDKVMMWGPLGTHFAQSANHTLLLAGGIGIAPFAGYMEQHKSPSHLSMLFAHRLPVQHYPVETFASQIEIETLREKSPDDLPKTIARVKRSMEQVHKENGLILACGPMPFLKFIWNYAKEIGAAHTTQLSLEQRMACGIGACLGCVATTSETYKGAVKLGLPVQTCTKGPVFWASDLDLDAKGM